MSHSFYLDHVLSLVLVLSVNGWFLGREAAFERHLIRVWSLVNIKVLRLLHALNFLRLRRELSSMLRLSVPQSDTLWAKSICAHGSLGKGITSLHT